MNIKGTLHKKYDSVQVSDRFKKREFVLEYKDNPLYPQYISFQLTQDRCDLLETYRPGDLLDVEFNLRGREWTSPQGEVKYFTTLEAWRLSPVQTTTPSSAHEPSPTPPPDALNVSDLQDDDDLPF
ncbi:MAG: DUF3127 domain-containing protein [Bacteroidia bacterium]|nr:DUF3127 domain-containing protein [Bacteroidia bacterium]